MHSYQLFTRIFSPGPQEESGGCPLLRVSPAAAVGAASDSRGRRLRSHGSSQRSTSIYRSALQQPWSAAIKSLCRPGPQHTFDYMKVSGLWLDISSPSRAGERLGWSLIIALPSGDLPPNSSPIPQQESRSTAVQWIIGVGGQCLGCRAAAPMRRLFSAVLRRLHAKQQSTPPPHVGHRRQNRLPAAQHLLQPADPPSSRRLWAHVCLPGNPVYSHCVYRSDY